MDSWLLHSSFYFNTPFQIYVSGLYYSLAILSTIGFGDVAPFNIFERLVTIAFILWAIVVYTHIINFSNYTFTAIHSVQEMLELKMKFLREFAKDQKLPKHLFQKIANNLMFVSEFTPYRLYSDDLSIFKDMPVELHYAFLTQLHPEIALNPFFEKAEVNFVIRMMHLWRPAHVIKGEYIWRKKDKSDFIVFIMTGIVGFLEDNFYVESDSGDAQRVKVGAKIQTGHLSHRFSADFEENQAEEDNPLVDRSSDPNPQEYEAKKKAFKNLLGSNHFVFKEYASGSYVGDEELLLKSCRKYHLRALTNCSIMMLSKNDYENIIKKEFPREFQELQKNARVKVDEATRARNLLLRDILKTAKKFGIFLSISTDYYALHLKMISKDKFEVPFLYQVYKECEERHPIEANLLDYEVQDYGQDECDFNEEEEDNDVDFQGMRTPGLETLYEKWASKLSRWPEGADQKPTGQ
jgi:CRP-like cAMP-binding protein